MQLAQLEKDEAKQSKQLEELETYHDQIQKEEDAFWTDFALYEKNLNNQ